MNSNATCPKCHLPLAEGVAEGLCARCLMKSGLLESLAGNPTITSHEPPPDQVVHTIPGLPRELGPYHMLGVLGEGGMGIVYLAEQREPVRRRVALKVLKHSEAGSQVIARFESESQALALMEHPNIAHVYDAGVTPYGAPYFAMEYVPGIPITDYCDRNLLGIRERLALFQQVCQAVQHAHQKGVIHRDIKPSNVLVMLQDGQPVPKVIDFGVAKAVNRPLVQKTLFTEIGMLIGTPEYMSPEQAELTGLDIDSRTDIYSLGVLLYELLVGALPFDSETLRKAGYAEIQRLIREEEPPKPSVRLSRLGGAAEETARRRSSDVRDLVRVLREDLEWITMKALEKDRTHRYASASEFAADIGRHLANQPVLAGPPGFVYSTRKFVRRHRGPVLAGTAIGLALLVGGIVSFTLYLRAARDRQVAELASYGANLSSADLQLRAGQAAEARSRLDHTPSTLRGWEWRHLMTRTDSSMATLYSVKEMSGVETHTRSNQIRLSQDGSELFCYRDAYLRSWDTTTKRLKIDLSGLGRVLAIGPFGRTVLVGPPLIEAADPPPEGFVLRLYEVSTRKQLAEFHGLAGPPGAASITDDLVAVTTDFSVQDLESYRKPTKIVLWNAHTGLETTRFEAPRGVVTVMRFGPDGQTLAAASSDRVQVWNHVAGLREIPLEQGLAWTLAFSDDGRQLAVAVDGVLRIWDPATGKLIRSLPRTPTGSIDAVAFSPDTSLVALAARGAVHIVDAATGEQHNELHGHPWVEAMAFEASGRRIYVAGFGVVKEFDVERNDVLAKSSAGMSGVAVSPDGRYIATASDDHLVRIYDAASNILLRTFTGHTAPARALAFSPDSMLLASGSEDHSVKLWSVSDGRLVRTFEGHNGWVSSLAFYPDGRQLVSASYDRTVRVWNIDGSTVPVTLSLSSPVCSVALSPDGHTIAALPMEDKIVSLWDAATKQSSGTLDNGTGDDEGGSCGAFTFSRDGHFLLAPADSMQSLAVWNFPKRKLERVVRAFGRTRGFRSIGVSPDGNRVALGGLFDGSLSIWDLRRETLMLSLSGHNGIVRSLAWTPDGTRLLTASLDGTVRNWDSRSPYNFEAELLVDRLSTHLLLASEIVDALQRDHTLTEDLRRQAIEVAEKRGDASYAFALLTEAWKVARMPAASREGYAQALRWSTEAGKVAPWYGDYYWTVALLQYRVGDFDKALTSGQRAIEIHKISAPVAHAIRAMAYYRLNNVPRAREEMVLSRQARDPKVSVDEKVLQEAESTLSSK